MQSLRDRLQKVGKSSGNQAWEILKESEDELREELASIQNKQKIAVEQGQKKLLILKQKKDELIGLRNQVLSLRDDYVKHTNDVMEELTKNGLDFQKVTALFQTIMDDAIKKQKAEIVESLEGVTPRKGRKIVELEDFGKVLSSVVEVLKANKTSNIHEQLKNEIDSFYSNAIGYFRIELWSFLQKNNIPMKSIDTSNQNGNEDFYQKLNILCVVLFDLDYLKTQSNVNSLENLISSFFGHLVNLCVDMIENEENATGFDWILACFFKWAQNLKDVVKIAIERMKIEKKENVDMEKIFNREFVKLIQKITKTYLETLEVEIFAYETSALFENARCFDALTACSLAAGNVRWASETTIHFEEWLTRLDSQIGGIRNSEAQIAFYEAAQLLLRDFRHRLHETANQLYMEPTWANDVYLVMNTVWEMRKILESITFGWPVDLEEVEREYEKEWNRLGDMIMEYLSEIVDSMDSAIRSSYVVPNDKIRKIHSTFHRVIKCLTNVVNKASGSSRSCLLNKLISELFSKLQVKFDSWQRCSLEILSVLYGEIYSNILPHLEYLRKNDVWERMDSSRAEITQLDALMKVAANSDPSGELVRTAFRSIDEEQVVKMLGELGIKTSDHAFQDYQILAENWNKIKSESL